MPGKCPKRKKSTHILIDTTEDRSSSRFGTGWLLDDDMDYNVLNDDWDYNVNKDPSSRPDTESARETTDSRKRVNINAPETQAKKQMERKTEEVEMRTQERKEVEDISHGDDIEKDIYQVMLSCTSVN